MSGPRNQVLVGDALEQLQRLPDGLVDSVVTSPPYYQLRNYAVPGQLGLESDVEQWVQSLRAVAREVSRVLTPTGTFWLNVGDSYAALPEQGAATKSLLLGPERLALALVADGWVLRNKLIWQKSNPMPSSVRDRFTCTYEVIYLFARSKHYYFDLDAVRLPHISQAQPRAPAPYVGREQWRGPNANPATGLNKLHAEGRSGHPLGKNPGDVLRLAASGYRSAHHATFPVNLAEHLVRVGCPERRCTACLHPWRRNSVRSLGSTATRGRLAPSCICPSRASQPGLVLDPFFGAGTTAVAAERLGRDWLGIELNPAFAALAESRIAGARSPAKRAA